MTHEPDRLAGADSDFVGLCTADLGFTGGKNDIGAGTDTDFIGACTPALT
jgi:hypothetical protein